MSKIAEMSQEVASAGLSRRHFVQGAAALAAGAVLPMTQILGASSVSAAPKSVLRVGIAKQSAAPTPFTTKDGGSLQILCAPGEWLAWQNQDGSLQPRVAESWKSSNASKTWTFKIRRGIKFHDGTPLTADDVVWTFKSHFDPKNKSAQLGNFKNSFTADGVVKVDDFTVRFDLLSSIGNFPYTVASTSYGSLIFKNGANGGPGWEKTMISCGAWILESYVEGNRTIFKKNPNYWDKTRQPSFEKLELIQFASASAATPLLRTGKLDAIAILAEDAIKLSKTKFNLVLTPSAGGLHTHMRTDYGPFQDKRVREAAALTLDRPGYIKGVLKGFATLANDSVMDSYPTKDTTVPQRKKDIAKAKALMKAAGVPNGFAVDLSSWVRDDISKLAQFIKKSFAEIGIKVTLKLDGSDGGGNVYYTYTPYPSKKGEVFAYDNNSWLASNLGITDWAGRAVPDQYLSREWRSTADWSSSHVNSPKLDAAIDEYLAAPNKAKQKSASKKIQGASLEETPYIIIYNQTIIAAVRKGLKGFYVNGITQSETAGVTG
ncbi:MAG: twin-arginine translocation signal domain-containing protein [Acidimicrobiaceae bacterium]|nr:twin-arginine translocation signal domain-containing protein [Acidimicrobiaceae bacterium]